MLLVDLRQRPLGLDDAERAAPTLVPHDVVQAARLVDPVGDVRRERQRDLSAAEQIERELRLLDRRDDALRLGHELGLAQPARRLRRDDEPARVLRAHVVVDALLHRLGAQLRDRVARVDALRAALVAEVAPPVQSQTPCSSLSLFRREIWFSCSRGSPTKRKPLANSGRPEEVRIGLHRVALGGTAAAHDAERLLVDHVHRLLGDDPLLLGNLVVARVEPRLERRGSCSRTGPCPRPVLGDREVAHRGDHRHMPRSTIGFMRSLQASTAAPSMRIPQEPQIIIRQLFR